MIYGKCFSKYILDVESSSVFQNSKMTFGKCFPKLLSTPPKYILENIFHKSFLHPNIFWKTFSRINQNFEKKLNSRKCFLEFKKNTPPSPSHPSNHKIHHTLITHLHSNQNHPNISFTPPLLHRRSSTTLLLLVHRYAIVPLQHLPAPPQ